MSTRGFEPFLSFFWTGKSVHCMTVWVVTCTKELYFPGTEATATVQIGPKNVKMIKNFKVCPFLKTCTLEQKSTNVDFLSIAKIWCFGPMCNTAAKLIIETSSSRSLVSGALIIDLAKKTTTCTRNFQRAVASYFFFFEYWESYIIQTIQYYTWWVIKNSVK